jgi:hypothetical protein
MFASKTWALAALGLAVSAPIDPTFAHEIDHTAPVMASAASDPPPGEDPTDSGRGGSAKDQPADQIAGASPIGSFISAFLRTDVGEGKRLRLPGLDQPEFEASVHCLALNIYHEARAEPEAGQQAVAAVTLNRVASPAFPNSVCQVVKQGGRKLNRCQFSWWCDRRPDEPRENGAWNRALALSRKALSGEISDPTRGALYYHATRVKPRWARTFERTGQIGQHIFYRLQGV